MASAPPSDLAVRLGEHGQEHLLRFWDELDADGRSRLAAELEALDLPQLDRLVETLVLGDGEEAVLDLATVRPGEVVRLEGGRGAARGRGGGGCGGAGGRRGRRGRRRRRVGHAARASTGPRGRSRSARSPPRACSRSTPRRSSRSAAATAPHPALRHDQPREPRGHRARSSTSTTTSASTTSGSSSRGRCRPSTGESGRSCSPRRTTSPSAPTATAARSPRWRPARPTARRAASRRCEQRGVRTLFYFQVDNPLVKIADPAFLGLHRQADAEMSFKVIEKADARREGRRGRRGRRPAAGDRVLRPARRAGRARGATTAGSSSGPGASPSTSSSALHRAAGRRRRARCRSTARSRRWRTSTTTARSSSPTSRTP